MPKQLLSLFIFLATIQFGVSQPYLVARGNLSIGAEYETLDYSGGDILYSPAGGMGFEVGLQSRLAKNLFLQSTLGYQLNLALQAESFNGVTNRSSFSFNRKFINVGLLTRFLIPEDIAVFEGFTLGSGVHFSFPGKLTRIENEEQLGSSRYKSNIGYYIDLGVRLRMSENVLLEPGIRYRRVQHDGKSFTEGPIETLPVALQNLNCNGVELGLTLIKTI